jgi:hypothetical protein
MAVVTPEICVGKRVAIYLLLFRSDKIENLIVTHPSSFHASFMLFAKFHTLIKLINFRTQSVYNLFLFQV